GGVAQNAQVLRWLTKTHPDLILVPEDPHLIAAIGAAELAQPAAHEMPRSIPVHENHENSGHHNWPLSMERSVYPSFETKESFTDEARTEVRLDHWPEQASTLRGFLGIDIGSTSTKAVLVNEEGKVILDLYRSTAGSPIEATKHLFRAMQSLEKKRGIRFEILGVGTTGSGRKMIGQVIGADAIINEISSHVAGAVATDPDIDTIFEIGGQDAKYISLQDGVVVDFTMNDACAAGTGSFLEERAEELEISIIDEFAELALSSDAPIKLGERCTVFMERDVADYMQRGAEKTDIVAGLAYSVIHNYINRVVRGRHIGECIFFQGGTAYNDAVVAAMSAVLDKEIIVPPHNGVMGAIGSALLARDKMATVTGEEPSEQDGQYVPVGASASRFRGYDLSKVDYNLREFTCKGCSNHCIVQEFTVEGEKTYWGDKCSDRYRKRSKSTTKPVIEDLFALREKLFNDESGLPDVPAGAPKIGIPRAMFAMDFLPFWRTFWRHCGFEVVVSEPTNRQTAASGLSNVVAEPCFPVIVAHGHVAELLETGVDYVFLPNTVSTETEWMQTESHICPWGQTLPFVVRRAPAFERSYDKFLCPCVRFRDGFKPVSKIMRQLGKRLGIKNKTVDSALSKAYETQHHFRR
ncbi:MAG: acyl-CoA dehydratase activase, partial [Verrucomicrobiota bacterium]|nr:acyl-CoA dehydratase activase [Verrucomicrobiota bacterium]